MSDNAKKLKGKLENISGCYDGFVKGEMSFIGTDEDNIIKVLDFLEENPDCTDQDVMKFVDDEILKVGEYDPDDKPTDE